MTRPARAQGGPAAAAGVARRAARGGGAARARLGRPRLVRGGPRRRPDGGVCRARAAGARAAAHRGRPHAGSTSSSAPSCRATSSATQGLAPDRFVLREVQRRGARARRCGGRQGRGGGAAADPVGRRRLRGRAAGRLPGRRLRQPGRPARRRRGHERSPVPSSRSRRSRSRACPKTPGGLGGGSAGDRAIQVMAPTERIKEHHRRRSTSGPASPWSRSPGSAVRVDQ